MLKTLEEPPPYAHLVLLTERPGKVLPTIASRCQRVRFDAPSPAAIADAARPPRGRAAAGRRVRAPRARRLRPRARARARRRPGPARGRRALRPRGAARRLRRRARGSSCSSARASTAPTPAARSRRGRPRRSSSSRRRSASASSARGPSGCKRAQRRATQAALDHGLELTGLWLRDVDLRRPPAPRSSSTTPTASTPLREDAAERDAAGLQDARRGDPPAARHQRQRGAGARAARLPR